MTNNEDYILELLLDTCLVTREQVEEAKAEAQPEGEAGRGVLGQGLDKLRPDRAGRAQAGTDADVLGNADQRDARARGRPAVGPEHADLLADPRLALAAGGQGTEFVDRWDSQVFHASECTDGAGRSRARRHGERSRMRPQLATAIPV